jgi:hypothetical protein
VVSNDSGFFLFNPHVPRASTKLSVRKSNAWDMAKSSNIQFKDKDTTCVHKKHLLYESTRQAYVQMYCCFLTCGGDDMRNAP